MDSNDRLLLNTEFASFKEGSFGEVDLLLLSFRIKEDRKN